MPKYSSTTKMIPKIVSSVGLIALVLLCENLLFILAQTTSRDIVINDTSIASQIERHNQTASLPATISIHRSVNNDTDDTDRPKESVLLSKEEFVDFTETPTLLFDNTNPSDTESTASNNNNSASSSASSPSTNASVSPVQSNASSIATIASFDKESSTAASPETGDGKNVTSSATEEPPADDSYEEDDNNGGGEGDSNDFMEDTKGSVKPFEPPKNVSQYMDYIETLFHDLRHQITDLFEPHIPQLIRTSQQVQLSGSCSYDMLRLALALRQFEPWALRMIDSSGKVPEGIFEGSFTALGSYDECLSTVFAPSSSSTSSYTTPNSQQPSSSGTSSATSPGEKHSLTQGKYCLVAVSPFMPPKPPADRIEHLFQEEASKRNHSKDDQFSRISPMFYYMKFRIGVCIPSTCDETDMNSISTALSSNLRLNITVPDCRVKQEMPLTRHQLIGGLTFAIVFISVIFATVVDYLYRTRRKNKRLSRTTICAVNHQIETITEHNQVDKCCHINRAFKPDCCDSGTTMPSNGTTVMINDSSNQIVDLNEKGESNHSQDGGCTKGFLRSFSVLVNYRLYFGKPPVPLDKERKEEDSHPLAVNNDTKQEAFIRRPMIVDCLNGIRVLSLCWVIVANSYITLDPRATRRLVKTREASRDFFFQLIMQASLAIETFFFLSGIMISLSFNRRLKETISPSKSKQYTLNRDHKGNGLAASVNLDSVPSLNTWIRWIHFYVHRYIRMTPATMLVIAISMYAYRYGDGPLWFEATHKVHQSCAQNWWRHLLHVANFLDTRQMCFIHYWYIAADMQLFLFAPIIMFLLYRYRRIGYAIVALIGAASAGFVFYTTYTRNLPPTLLFYNSDPESRREFGNTVMTKPLTHALPYLVGILVGEILSRQNQVVAGSSESETNHFLKRHNRATLTTLFGSTITVVALVELFLPYKWNNSHLPTRLLSAMYASVFRFAWSLVLAFIVLSCRHKRTRKCRYQSQKTQNSTSNQLDRSISTTQSTDPYENLCHSCKTSNSSSSQNKWSNGSQQYFIGDANSSQFAASDELDDCYCGSAGNIVNRFLSFGIFTPLSKLSFVAYLIHLPLMSMFVGQTRGVFAFSHTLVIHLALSYLMMTFLLSFALVHIIEFPFLTFESYLFNTLYRYNERRTDQSTDSAKDRKSTENHTKDDLSKS